MTHFFGECVPNICVYYDTANNVNSSKCHHLSAEIIIKMDARSTPPASPKQHAALLEWSELRIPTI
jgi:hypothetical protein